jgi:hypothetical protein
VFSPWNMKVLASLFSAFFCGNLCFAFGTTLSWRQYVKCDLSGLEVIYQTEILPITKDWFDGLP